MDLLLGFHAVEAALLSGRRQVERIWIERSRDRARVRHLRDLARRSGVVMEEVDRAVLQRIAEGQPRSAHQGVVASVAALPYADPEEILASCGKESLLLVADGVEDPRNLGALIRTAAGAGAAAVFIPGRRAAGVTPAAARASAGAVDRVPVARVGNLPSFLNSLKEAGFWTIGLDASAPTAWDQTTYPARTALVVGGEEKGLGRLVRERCDETVSIPLSAGVESLNLSVAAGICLYEALRQRRAARGR